VCVWAVCACVFRVGGREHAVLNRRRHGESVIIVHSPARMWAHCTTAIVFNHLNRYEWNSCGNFKNAFFFLLDRHPHARTHNAPMHSPQARFRLKTREEDPAWQCQTNTKTRKEQVSVAEWHFMCSIPLINTHTIAVMGVVNLHSFSRSEPFMQSCRVHPLLTKGLNWHRTQHETGHECCAVLAVA
jgi:hypothetical protein